MHALHVGVESDAVSVACAITRHQHDHLWFNSVAHGSQHLNLQALVETLLAARHTTSFIQLGLDPSRVLKAIPYGTLLRRNGTHNTRVAEFAASEREIQQVLEMKP